MRKSMGSLWRNADFRRLWVGQTSSMLGTSMLAVAVPIIASITLRASPFQMGLLVAAEFLPYLLVSLVVGVRLDRRPKRPVIIFADAARTIILVVIPVAWYGHFLSIPLLLGVMLLTGTGAVISDIGVNSYLPSLVTTEELIEGNSKLEMSNSVSATAGMALGGAIVQALTAPAAIFLNVGAYALSAISTASIRHREPEPPPEEEPPTLWHSAKEGLTFVLSHQTLRILVASTVIANFFALAIDPLFLVLITRTLHLLPVVIGVILGSMGAGSLLGATLAGPLGKRFTFGPLVIGSAVIIAFASLLTPASTLVPKPAAVALLLVMQVLNAAMVLVCNINIRSYRTSITPDDLQGRMNAVVRMAVMGGTPFGALFGGLLGTWFGTPLGLVFASIGMFVSAGLLWLSPIRHVTGLGAPAPSQEAEVVT